MSTSHPSDDIPEIVRALGHISAEPRDTWVMVGMALHKHLGDEGFDIWDNWSKGARNYDERVVETSWKNFKVGGAVGIGSLFHTAKLHGYHRDPNLIPQVDEPGRLTRRRRDRRAEQKVFEQQEAERIALQDATSKENARRLMAGADLSHHPYLSLKGFPRWRCQQCSLTFDWKGVPFECPVCESMHIAEPRRMLVRNDKMLIPMRDIKTGDVVSVQSIDAEGNKRYMKGGRKKNTMFRIGRGREIWMCEGYATALSLQVALQEVQRSDFSVVVVFDAFNFVAVAKTLVRNNRGVAVADNDPWRCRKCKHGFYSEDSPAACERCRSTDLIPPTGLQRAMMTTLPVFMPSQPGDVNDLHMRHGLTVLAEELRRFLGIGDYGGGSHSTCARCGGVAPRTTSSGHVVFKCIQCGRETQWR